jgi:hypothetical protein
MPLRHEDGPMTPQPMVPPQKPHVCPHCKTVNWLAIPPDAVCSISAQILYNCIACGRCFCHIIGADRPITLFLVRCSCALAAFPGPLAVLWFGALLYCLWWIFNIFGAASTAALLVGCYVLLSLGHEGLKAVPLALWLLLPVVPLCRFVLLYLLHRPEHVHAISALLVLIVAGAAWFGAPPAPPPPPLPLPDPNQFPGGWSDDDSFFAP